MSGSTANVAQYSHASAPQLLTGWNLDTYKRKLFDPSCDDPRVFHDLDNGKR